MIPSMEEARRWISHLPALLACVEATGGDVLELGVGYFSTPMLHSSVTLFGRTLVSLESDPEWEAQFADYKTKAGQMGPHSGAHHILPLTEPELADCSMREWGVVFIDDTPGPDRYKHVARFLPCSEFVVLHDAEGENIMEHVRPLIADVPFQFMHKRFDPWTLVLSRTRPIPPIP